MDVSEGGSLDFEGCYLVLALFFVVCYCSIAGCKEQLPHRKAGCKMPCVGSNCFVVYW